MREVSLRVWYMVCWAGCNIPASERTFERWDHALEYYNKNLNQLSLRIEEITTKTIVKIVFPESGRAC